MKNNSCSEGAFEIIANNCYDGKAATGGGFQKCPLTIDYCKKKPLFTSLIVSAPSESGHFILCFTKDGGCYGDNKGQIGSNTPSAEKQPLVTSFRR